MKITLVEAKRSLKYLKKQEDQVRFSPDLPRASDQTPENIVILQEIKKILEDIPEIRSYLTSNLKKEISNNSYKVTDEEIAEKMLARLISDNIY